MTQQFLALQLQYFRVKRDDTNRKRFKHRDRSILDRVISMDLNRSL